MHYNGRGKLKPKHTSIDGITFDSVHEAAVWKALKRISGIEVERQHPLLIKPTTNLYPAKYWKVDFAIPSFDLPNYYSLYVEAKALITPEFELTVQLAEYCSSRDFRKLLIVFPDAFANSTTGQRQIKLANKYLMKWCFLSDVRDTVMARML